MKTPESLVFGVMIVQERWILAEICGACRPKLAAGHPIGTNFQRIFESVDGRSLR